MSFGLGDFAALAGGVVILLVGGVMARAFATRMAFRAAGRRALPAESGPSSGAAPAAEGPQTLLDTRSGTLPEPADGPAATPPRHIPPAPHRRRHRSITRGR